MNRRVAVGLAWSLGCLSVAMFVAFADLAILLAFPIVGTLIASRRPENPIGWICLTVGLFWMLIGLKEASDAYALARFGSEWSSLAFHALMQWPWVPPVALLGIYMILLFPDGKLPSRRWRPFAWFAGAVMALMTYLDNLHAELVTVVQEAMQPGHVSLWLRPDTVSSGQEWSDESKNGRPVAVKGLHRR